MPAKSGSSRITLAQVAAQAGVSTTTASLILSERADYLEQFHPNTVRKVRDVAERLGYRANLFASSLHPRGSSFFALVMNSLGRDQVKPWLHRAFDGDLLAGVVQAASQLGVYPVVATAGPDADEPAVNAVEAIMAGGVFGTIVRTPNDLLEKSLRNRLDLNHPVVVIFPNRLSQWASNAIDVDNVAVGRTAANMLIAAGRKKLAIVYDQTFYEGQVLRCRGFEDQAHQAGLEIAPFEMPAWSNDQTIRDLLTKHFSESRPDGVFTVTLDASIGAVQAAVTCGLGPGDDLSLVGCDCSLWQSSPLPRITSVDAAWTEAGSTALRKLMELARTGMSRFDNVLLRPRIVPGQTCAVPDDLMS